MKRKELRDEIRQLSAIEAAAKMRELRQELFNLRLQQQTTRLERSSRVREVRKQIARIETKLNGNKLPAASAAK